MALALRVSDAVVSYGPVVAVAGVSFDVARGDFFCLVGANGSGKSSLVKALLGVVPLASGSVTFGVPRERVAYMPQISSIPRDMPATAREVAITGRQSTGRLLQFYAHRDRAAVDEAFERLGISDIANRRIGELSGGQRQRVLLARALVGEPELLFLDEPYAGLDEASAKELRLIMGELNGTGGITIVMVSHDMIDVRRSATRVAVIDRRLLFCGTPSDWERYRAAI